MIYYIYMFSGKLKLKVHKCILLRTESQCNEMWSTILSPKRVQDPTRKTFDWLVDIIVHPDCLQNTNNWHNPTLHLTNLLYQRGQCYVIQFDCI